MAQVKRRKASARKPAATNDRNFRTFLLVSQLEAKAIGARLAQARNEAGLTQEEVAEMATFSKRSLQDYEAGVTIPYRHFRELSGYYDRPVEWFLHGDPETQRQTPPEPGGLLGEVAASVARLEMGQAEILDRLSQIREGLRQPGGAGTGTR